jgi:hypothetical protein
MAPDPSASAVFWDAISGQQRIVLMEPWVKVTCSAFSPDSRYAVTGSEDGLIRVAEVALAGRIMLVLASLKGGNDWLVATPEGLFDGSPGGREGVSWRIGDDLHVASVDRFFQDFYRPGLLKEVWRGQRPLPRVELGRHLPPKLRILAPQPGTTDSPEVTVEVEALDQGGGVTGPTIYQNGARLLPAAQTRREGNVVHRSFNLMLVEGENQLRVAAASADGSWESEPALLMLRYEKPLISPELHVVAVGISRYAEGTLRLKFAAADAAAVANLFQERGPVLYGQGKVHVHQLLDQQASKPAILRTLADVAQQARPQDTLVLLLAGHGMMVGQRFYFLPHELEASGELEEAVRRQGLASDQLDDAVSAVPALKRVVIYDTCQSGGVLGPTHLVRSPFIFQKALEQMSRAQGSFILAATAAGEEAQESAQLGHGVLTYTLLARLGAVTMGPLKDRAMPRADVLKVRDWFAFAQDEVPALTKVLFGREQYVKYIGSGADFPILASPPKRQ